MARFQIVPLSDFTRPRLWGIEEIIPGEKPNPTSFQGNRDQAEAEVSRLNLFGRTGSPSASQDTQTPPRRKPTGKDDR
jgi:hypothetical protein